MFRNYFKILVLTFLWVPFFSDIKAQNIQMSDGLFVWVRAQPQNFDPVGVVGKAMLPYKTEWKDLLIEKAFTTQVDPLTRIVTVTGFEKAKEKALMALIKDFPEVELVEAIPRRELCYTPNDLLSSQWGLKKIEAEKAWNLCKGGKGIVVALIDDGMDTAHVDLKGVLWHNAKEIPGNGKDDDGNGYKDDWFGWDAADNDNNPCVVVSDRLNHGTHCAGIMGAVTDNSKGIASIGYNIKIMPVKCVTKNFPRSIVNGYKAIDYAMNNGANIISMSWGDTVYSYTEQAVFAAANTKGILCVAAAGNNHSSTKVYPAAYSYVLAVGATASNDKKCAFSNYGTWLDVMAPGSNIYSTIPGNAYAYMDGTSMACPLVSGLAALMWSRNTMYKAAQIESCLKSTCDNIDVYNPSYIGQLGAGRINAYKALQCIKSIVAVFASSKTWVCPGDTVQFWDKSYIGASSWKWAFTGGTPSTSTSANPQVRYNSAGKYNVQLIVGNGTDYDTITVSQYITAGQSSVKFSGQQIVAKGDYATIRADFTGSGPWKLIYTNGIKKDTINSITNNPYFFLVLPDTTHTYKPLEVWQSGCKGTVSDSARITVYKRVGSSCDSAYRFQMLLGGSGDDIAYVVKAWDDTSVLVAGKTASYGSGNYDGFLARVSIFGRTIWFKTYGGTAEDVFLAAIMDDEKNIYAVGHTYSGTSSKGAWIIKTNSIGNVLWKKHYDGSSLEYITAIKLSRDRKYVYVTGPSISGSFGGEDFTLYKIDTAGTVAWVKQIGDADFNRNYDIFEDSSGNIYTAGAQGSPFPDTDIGITKVSSSGSLIGNKRSNFPAGRFNESFFDLMPWKEKAVFGYGFSGAFNGSSYTTYEFCLARMDLNCNIVWAKKYTLGTITPLPFSIMVGDNIYLYGAYSNNNGDGYILKLDTNGNILRSVAIGTSSTAQAIQDMAAAPDDGFYFVGSDNTGGNNQIWVGKTNCSLNAACNTNAVTPTVTAMAVSTTSTTYSIQDFNTAKTVSVTTSTNTVKPSITCKTGITLPNKQPCDLKADFQISGACTGQQVWFTDQSSVNSSWTLKNWFWNFDDGWRGVGQSNLYHYFENNGTYKIQLITEAVRGLDVCLDTVYHIYKSTDSLSIKKMTPDTLICYGDSVRLSVPLTNCGVGPFQYAWTPPTGISDTALDMPYFSPKKTTRYYVTITDYNGISIRDSLLITVSRACCNSIPRFIPKKPVTCLGDSTWLINTSTYKKNASFKWRFSGANIPSFNGKTPPGLKYSATGEYSITLILTDSCTIDSFVSHVIVSANPIVFAGNDTTLCVPDTIELGSPGEDWYSYEWKPQTGLDNPYISSPTAAISGPINYVLKVTSDAGCFAYDTIKIKQFKLSPDLGKDSTLCTGDSIFLKSDVKAPEYLWNTGSKIDSTLVDKAGLYWLEASISGCKFRDSINIYFDTLPTFTLGPDTTLCEDKAPLLITPKNVIWPAALRQWDDASTGNTRNVSSSGVYWLEMKNNLCKYRDSIAVIFDKKPVLSLGNDTTICENRSVTLIPQGGFGSGTSYVWDNGDTTSTRMVSQKGNYWLKVVEKTCSMSDTISVFTDSLPNFSLGNDTAICEKQFPVSVTAKNIRIPGATKLWENGSNTVPRIVTTGGVYWLTMQNGTCVFKDTISIAITKNPQFTLGNDTIFCTLGGNLVLQPQGTLGSGATYFWDDASTGSQRSVDASGLYWLKVTENMCDAEDSIKVQMDTIPQFSLGNDTAICPQNFPLTVSPKTQLAKNPSYIWENGSIVPGRSIATVGNYWLKASNSNCTYLDSIRIDSLQRPYVKLPADTGICFGDTLGLKAPVYANTTYDWNTGEKTYNKTVLFAGYYEVTLKNRCGQAKDDINIVTKDCSCPIYIPNSFTPSHSPNINDDFHVVFGCPYEKFEIMIYNRWGELVFRSTDAAFRWNGVYDGRVVPNGAYLIVMKLKQRYENNGKEFLRSGYLYVAE